MASIRVPSVIQEMTPKIGSELFQQAELEPRMELEIWEEQAWLSRHRVKSHYILCE